MTLKQFIVSMFISSMFACNQQQVPIRPEMRCKNCGFETLPGDVIPIEANWSARCNDSFSNFLDSFLAKTENNPPNSMECVKQKFSIDLSCSAPCKLEAAKYNRNFDFGVVPRDPGPFSFILEMKNEKSGETKIFKSPLIEVRAPDGIGLYCYYAYEENDRRFEPCDNRPLSRSFPFIMPVYEYGTKTRVLETFKLNGMSLKTDKKRMWKGQSALSLESVLTSKVLESSAGIELVLEKEGRMIKTIVWIQ